jgi:hypothetical protein
VSRMEAVSLPILDTLARMISLASSKLGTQPRTSIARAKPPARRRRLRNHLKFVREGTTPRLETACNARRFAM